MDYIKLVIDISEQYQGALVAELFSMEFKGFEQQEETVIAYTAKDQFGISERNRLEQLLQIYPVHGVVKSEEVIADKNWNKEWEKSITSQEIGSFLVKPSWSDDRCPDGKIVLNIDPKLSFGTGYHETTQLMLRAMPQIINDGDSIIDAGTGTGILSIAAVKLGAKHALAFDISEWSIRNAKENIVRNNVSDEIDIKKGSPKIITEDQKADVILANIERKTILSLLPRFKRYIVPGGSLLISGILKSDLERVSEALNSGFNIVDTHEENEWLAIHAKEVQ